MTNRTHVKVIAIYINETKVRQAGPGENLRVRVSGIDDEASETISPGFVLSSVANPIPGATELVAKLQTNEQLDKPILTAGYNAMLHIHSMVEFCVITELIQEIDPKMGRPRTRIPVFVKTDAVIVCRIQIWVVGLID